jgi:hypothetical protein
MRIVLTRVAKKIALPSKPMQNGFYGVAKADHYYKTSALVILPALPELDRYSSLFSRTMLA